jgi:hypothetical protein
MAKLLSALIITAAMVIGLGPSVTYAQDQDESAQTGGATDQDTSTMDEGSKAEDAGGATDEGSKSDDAESSSDE